MKTKTITDKDVSRRITRVLFSGKSLHSMAMMAIFTVTPIIAVQMTGSEASAGVPGTAVLIGRAAGAYPVGWIMDRVGRRIGLSVGFMAAIVGTIAGALAVVHGYFALLLAGALFVGVSRSALEQTRYIAAEVQPAENRARVISVIVFSGTVGSLGGRLVIGLSDRLTEMSAISATAGPWILASSLMGLGLLLNQIFLRPDPLDVGRRISATEAREDPDTLMSSRPMKQIFRIPNVILSVSVMAFAQLSMALVMIVTPLYIHYLGYGTSSMSTALMLHTLGMFALSSITGWLINVLGQGRVVLLGTLLLVVSGIVGYSSSVLLAIYIAVFLLGLGWNFCHIAGSSKLSEELMPQERGRAQGISEVLVGVTAAVGTLSSGIIYDAFGYAGANMAALGSVCVLLLCVTFVRWAQARDASVSPQLPG